MPKRIRNRGDSKPKKPYAGYPLFAHASGRWAKKIRGRIHFFGRWGHVQAGQVVPVDDVETSAAGALERFQREWPYLSQGRTPPPVDAGDGCTMRMVCNAFLTSKKNKLESGELSARSFTDYYRTCERLLDHFRKDRRVDDLRPDDFEGFRKALAKRYGIVTLRNRHATERDQPVPDCPEICR